MLLEVGFRSNIRMTERSTGNKSSMLFQGFKNWYPILRGNTYPCK